MEVAEKDPKSLILLTADMARSDPPMVSSFVAEFARRLQGQSTALALPLTWIEQRLSESGLTIEQLVRSENQQKAADQVSVSNSIGSLRFLAGMDWREFVETMSVVDRVLREDPGGSYGRMDFTTRDRYRHAVEKIAKRSVLHEVDVARKAILLAGEGAAGNGPDDRAAHVGYYLIDKGLPRLERAAGARLPILETLRRTAGRFPLPLYLGAIALLAAGISGALLAKAHADGLRGWPLALFGALSLLCASRPAVALVNWLATLLVKPYPLPRMDFSEGIPPESRTLVVVPTMLTSPRGIESLIESMEVRFLANRDDNLHFGLLTDFRDADGETTPEDGQLLQLARNGIERTERQVRECGERPVLPFSPSTPMEPPGTDLDGIRTQAGKACGVEPAPSRRGAGSLFRRRRQDGGPVERPVRDPPRHGYATAARRGAAVRRGHGAPAEPCAVRRADAARLRGARHFAAERGRQPVGHEPFAIRAFVRERTGDRPVHARRLRCVPGRVRRRILHRQGDLRRRRVRAGPPAGGFPRTGS